MPDMEPRSGQREVIGATKPGTATDVHQHLWPPPFVEALRRRANPPRLDGWTLHLAGEPPYDVDPAAHDVDKRAAVEREHGFDRVMISPSSPLGIERLAAAEAVPLLDAWHQGVRALPEPFRAWAAATTREIEPTGLAAALDGGCVGLQVPADAVATPAGWEHLGPLLALCEDRGRAVLVHPGPASVQDPRAPVWWAPIVEYVGQLHAAWWSWHLAGRALFPRLRIGFVAGAGLAPLHHERLVARGGTFDHVDPHVYVDTSSYAVRALDALVRVLGVDVIVFGSDRPYAEPADTELGAAASHAIRHVNPARFLEGAHGFVGAQS